MMDQGPMVDLSKDLRERHRGLIGVELKVPVRDRHLLSVVYTPGVAGPCEAIHREPGLSFRYTCRGNTIALVTDGSRVLGLGPLGPEAALPVMEAKSVIFKTFAGVDAFPICLATQEVSEIVQTVLMLAPTFGAVCLEDISSPRCFEVEGQLREALNIPVLHNDQHAAAVLALACLINACKVTGKPLVSLKVVINGAGAAGIATARLLLSYGIKDIVLCDKMGALYKYRPYHMNWVKHAIARRTNPSRIKGGLEDALRGADAFVGFSTGGVIDAQMISSMAPDPVVLAFATPEPEISYEEAKGAGARVVAVSTGPRPVPNELDIAMVYPGIFRGTLDVGARQITEGMLVEAAETLSGLVDGGELCEEKILPPIMDFCTAPALAEAVAAKAMEEGLARRQIDPKEVFRRTERYIYEGRFPVESPTGITDDLKGESIELHARYQGVVGVRAKIPIKDQRSLRMLYLPPAAAEAPLRIKESPLQVYELTCKSNLVAVVTDGSAVLGLGDIGPRAAMPVMEGKCVLFQAFGGVEAYPICVGTQDVEEFVDVVAAISPGFGGINLEDISAPRCFSIEERLLEALDIPVFHDDQHGTAVVVLAGLINALEVVGKSMEEISVVISGAGAAAIAVARMLLACGVNTVVLCDRRGAIYPGRREGMNPVKEKMAQRTNPEGLRGPLETIVKGRDAFIGLSAPNLLTPEMVRSMAPNAIIFALANPDPEIHPQIAREAGAAVVATGRSDFPNQVNNCLGFPGIFRGALDVMATCINEQMKLAAAHALAQAVPRDRLGPEFILPEALDLQVPPMLAGAVARAALESGVARRQVDPEAIARNTLQYLQEGGVLHP